MEYGRTKKAGARRTHTNGSGDGWFQAKLGMMLLFLLMDMVFNSSVEYDDFEAAVGGNENDLLTVFGILVGLQLLMEVAALLILFHMMFDTYPFRAGLMGLLSSQFTKVYVINALYILSTALLYSYRIGFLVSNNYLTAESLFKVWSNSAYAAFSILHKIGACVYYVANIRAAFKLRDPMFYTKDAWVALYLEQTVGLQGGAKVETAGQTRRPIKRNVAMMA